MVIVHSYVKLPEGIMRYPQHRYSTSIRHTVGGQDWWILGPRMWGGLRLVYRKDRNSKSMPQKEWTVASLFNIYIYNYIYIYISWRKWETWFAGNVGDSQKVWRARPMAKVYYRWYSKVIQVDKQREIWFGYGKVREGIWVHLPTCFFPVRLWCLHVASKFYHQK